MKDMNEILWQTDLPGQPPPRRGKVRDIYDLGDRLLIVTTDRISAFDVVLPNGIPSKGAVLTQLSMFWFDLLQDVVASHVLSGDAARLPPQLEAHANQLAGRSMLC